jgi:hypothetical protein
VSYLRYYGRLACQAGYSIAKGVALPFFRHKATRSGVHEMAHPIATYVVFPEDTADQISDSTFRLCCDVDVYESARGVLEWVWPRLAVGGVVALDDYGFPAWPGVTKLVDEHRMHDRLVLHNLNSHGLIVKR